MAEQEGWTILYASKGGITWESFETADAKYPKFEMLKIASDYIDHPEIAAIAITNGPDFEYVKRFDATRGDWEIWLTWDINHGRRQMFTDLSIQTAQRIVAEYQPERIPHPPVRIELFNSHSRTPDVAD